MTQDTNFFKQLNSFLYPAIRERSGLGFFSFSEFSGVIRVRPGLSASGAAVRRFFRLICTGYMCFT